MKEVIKKRKEQERQERIERILNAARNLFLEKGYLNTSMRNISLESELSTGAIYFYFKKKDEIYYRICEEAFDLLLSHFKKAYNPKKKGLDNLRALGLAYTSFYENNRDHYRLLDTITLWQDLFAHDIKEKFQPKMKKLLAIVHKTVVNVLEERGLANSEDSWKITLNLWASVEGLFTIHKMGQLTRLGFDFKDLIEKQLAIFEKGLS